MHDIGPALNEKLAQSKENQVYNSNFSAFKNTDEK